MGGILTTEMSNGPFKDANEANKDKEENDVDDANNSQKVVRVNLLV